jgi:hypothetical protein
VSALYLYAIVDEPPRDQVGMRNLSVLRAGGAHVVVERRAMPAATAANLKMHDRIVRRIARSCGAVLPFRFGAAVSDRAALVRLLEPLEPAILRALALVRDAAQFTLRVYGQRAPRPKSKRGEGPGTRFLADRLRAHRVPEIASVTDATKPFVRAMRVERHDRAPLLASVYHLVACSDVRRYRAALAAASKTLEGVRVDATGPWPPYAFAEMS